MERLAEKPQNYPAKMQFTVSQKKENKSSTKSNENRSHHYISHFKVQTKD